MSLFDEMLKNDKYRQLFDQLSDDQRPIIMNAIRQMVENVEKTIIKPFQNMDSSSEKSKTK